jgi:hypothetical protein
MEEINYMTLYDRYLKSSVISTSVVLFALILAHSMLLFISKLNPKYERFSDYSGLLFIISYLILVFSILLFLLVLKKVEDKNIKYATILAVLCTASLIAVVFWLSLKVFGPILITVIS